METLNDREDDVSEHDSPEIEAAWAEHRAARFQALMRIQANRPSYPEEEVEADVAGASAVVRAAARKEPPAGG